MSYKRNKRRRRKLEAIKYLGGKCQRCKGIFHPSVYDFHHRDSSEKEGNFTAFRDAKWGALIEELNKCDLLCANCHRLTHSEMEKTYEPVAMDRGIYNFVDRIIYVMRRILK